MTDHSGNQDKVAEPMQPQLCVKCYEFFGNAANFNMCSKCYKDFCSHKESTETPKEVKALPIRNALSMDASSTPAETSAAPVVTTTPEAQIQTTMTATPAVQAEACPCPTPESCSSCKPTGDVPAVAAPAGQQPPQKHKNRCFKCKKKIGLTGFKCRCGYIFCSEHRYSDKHECTFDYKLAGRQSIEKANPKVVASKINKI